MKKDIRNNGFKLSAYSSLAIAGVIALPSQAQIVYHDIDPDLVIDPEDTCIPEPPGYDYSPGGDFDCGETFTEFVDMNFDGTIDFKLKANHDYWSYWPSQYHTNSASLFAYGLNRIARADEGGGPAWAEKFVFGGLIGPSDSWNPGKHRLGYWNYENEDADHAAFAGFKYVFAGVRLKDASGEHFGWLRLSIDSMTDVTTVHDFAYRSEPGIALFAGETGDCYPPSISAVANITPTAAKLKWAPVYEATKYQLYYRQAGIGAPWTKLILNAALVQKSLTGLSCDTEYEFKMRTKCGGMLSAFSSIHTFTTASCKLDGDEEMRNTDILIHPNPAAEMIMVDLLSITDFTKHESVSIEIFDMTGRMVHAFTTDETNIKMNVSGFAAGNYILKVRSAQSTVTEQFIISR